MNIALEETQEVVEGVQRGKYGDTFIRGNNGEAKPSCLRPKSSSLTELVSMYPIVLYITAKE